MVTKKGFKEIGIDISHWNRVIDFDKVKASGVSFVIIKAGGSDKGFYKDRQFENYYRLAKNAGLKVGAYYFVGPLFQTMTDGIEDAKRFMNIIRGKEFDYPVFLDLESTSPKIKEGATCASVAFLEELEAHGYFAGIYASDISGFKERLNIEELKPYAKWVAKYSTKKPEYVKDFDIWQYSSKGSIDGIIGPVDLDNSLTDFSAIIKSKNFNRG